MRPRTLCALLALGVLTALPGTAQAQLEFGADRPRVFSIQRRPYRLGHEFQIGLGILPLDAFYAGMVASGSYTYHFSDFWAWEIAGGGYSLNLDTGLRDDLLSEFGVEPVGEGERIQGWFSTSAVAKPLFGKLSVFNLDIVYAETFFTIGLGPHLKDNIWRPTLNLGVGMRFWSSPALSWRVDIREYLIFSDILTDVTVEGSLFLMLSASFNYFNAEEQEEDTEWPD